MADAQISRAGRGGLTDSPHLPSNGYDNAVELILKVAREIYQEEKFKSRDEFGELLLHIAVRQRYKIFPAVLKTYFKESSNKTVAGFDITHDCYLPAGPLSTTCEGLGTLSF